MIYVLLLEENKIYVGYSQNLGRRVWEHFNSHGSKWTTKYRPLEVLYALEGEIEDEDRVTLEMMEIYGWINVRGGRWTQVEMISCPSELLKH